MEAAAEELNSADEIIASIRVLLTLVVANFVSPALTQMTSGPGPWPGVGTRLEPKIVRLTSGLPAAALAGEMEVIEGVIEGGGPEGGGGGGE
jgi:hypothetical protein